MAALSFVTYFGDGVLTQFTFPFPYLDPTHVKARVNGVEVGVTWLNGNTFEITPAPADGAVVELRRETPRDERMVDFTDGSVLLESDLDLSDIQILYIVQEAIDIAGGTLGIKPDGSYDANLRRITNLGDPVDARDAVHKSFVETSMTSQVNQAATSASNAAASASAAATSKSGADAAKAAAEAARDSALSYQTGAQSAQTAAEAARDLALTYRDTASSHKDAAAASATAALTSEQNAAASAAAAATFDPANYVPKLGNVSEFTNDAGYITSPDGGNAATLEGNNAAFFRNASNLNAGTVPNAQMPAAMQLDCAVITDWNNATTDGFYKGNAALNSPDATSWHAGWVVSMGGLYKVQFVVAMLADAAGTGTVWMRNLDAGSWGGWKKVLNANGSPGNQTISASAPSGGKDGDVWYQV